MSRREAKMSNIHASTNSPITHIWGRRNLLFLHFSNIKTLLICPSRLKGIVIREKLRRSPLSVKVSKNAFRWGRSTVSLLKASVMT